MLYCEAYDKVKAIFQGHFSCFNDTFEKALVLVGGFDGVEKMNVVGGNRFCGKDMVSKVRVERDEGVAERLRRGRVGG